MLSLVLVDLCVCVLRAVQLLVRVCLCRGSKGVMGVGGQ